MSDPAFAVPPNSYFQVYFSDALIGPFVSSYHSIPKPFIIDNFDTEVPSTPYTVLNIIGALAQYGTLSEFLFFM